LRCCATIPGWPLSGRPWAHGWAAAPDKTLALIAEMDDTFLRCACDGEGSVRGDRRRGGGAAAPMGTAESENLELLRHHRRK